MPRETVQQFIERTNPKQPGSGEVRAATSATSSERRTREPGPYRGKWFSEYRGLAPVRAARPAAVRVLFPAHREHSAIEFEFALPITHASWLTLRDTCIAHDCNFTATQYRISLATVENPVVEAMPEPHPAKS